MPEEDSDDLRERAQPHIKFGSLNDKNVGQLRKLNLAVFPVKYNDKFYTDLSTSPTQEYTHIAFFSDTLVGAICSRVEPTQGSKFKVYIMTIGVLAPYRNIGIGTKLLQQVLEACSKQADCEELYLHVQVNNQEAMDFYQRFGFSVGEVIKDYYKRIEPADAVLVSHKPPFSK